MQPHTVNKAALVLKASLFCIVFTSILILLSLAKNLLPPGVERLAHGIIGTIAGFSATFLFIKFDKRKFRDVELYLDRNTPKKFLVGVVTGVIVMGLLATGVMYFTHVKIELNPKADIPVFLLTTTPLLLLAFMEELGFRAYPIQILKDGIGIWGSIIITSVLFALYHVANGWTIAGSFSGPAVWGLLFGLAAIYSRGIAMPTAIHYAANLTTSAFRTEENTLAIWTVTPASTDTTNHHFGIDWATILPACILLVLGITCIELYRRKVTSANSI